MKIRNVNIIGMGALGMLFGKMIADSIGFENVSYVMDEKRYERHKDEKYTVNNKSVLFHIVNEHDAIPCDLIIVAVKYTGLEQALDVMKSSVGDGTIIISLMNGITSEKIIGGRYGMNHIIYAVAQGMDAMHFGSELVYSKPGRICIGLPKGNGERSASEEDLERLIGFFDETGVPYTAEEDITYRMWSKFMLNVGVNQTCMVFDTGYAGAMEEGSEAAMAMYGAMREVVLLAQTENISLSEEEVKQYIEIIKTLDPKATPSMGQDRINRKPSEVEMFAGTVIRMADEKGIAVPANRFLYRRVHEIEAEYTR